MKVLLCTPYIGAPLYVQGGLVVWSQNIFGYSKTQSSKIQIYPISFDRSVKGRTSKSELQKKWYNYSELGISVFRTLVALTTKKVDVLHLCSSAGPSLKKDKVILYYARKRGIKSVIHFHFGRIPDLFQDKNKEYEELVQVLNLATAIVTMDKRSYDCLKLAGYNNVYYLPNPISDELISSISMKEAKERHRRQLLYVGHVYKSKGVYELVQVCKTISDINLRIVGKVTEKVKDQLQEIAGPNHNTWLHFIGEIDHDCVIDEFLQSDLFVFPSYTEGFPNVILEAMACRIPIITTGVGAIPEMLQYGSEKCGILVEPQNVTQLSNAVQYLIDNEREKKILTENAFIKVTTTYTISTIWNQLFSIWKDDITSTFKKK